MSSTFQENTSQSDFDVFCLEDKARFVDRPRIGSESKLLKVRSPSGTPTSDRPTEKIDRFTFLEKRFSSFFLKSDPSSLNENLKVKIKFS